MTNPWLVALPVLNNDIALINIAYYRDLGGQFWAVGTSPGDGILYRRMIRVVNLIG